MLTSAQIRAARGLLNWSAADLAEKISAARQTIQRLEQSEGVPPSRTQTLLDIKAAFEAAGIEFIGTPERGAGVRFKVVDEN
jgi:ribosome-binding protein aMBF1 (putative translation factor)